MAFSGQNIGKTGMVNSIDPEQTALKEAGYSYLQCLYKKSV